MKNKISKKNLIKTLSEMKRKCSGGGEREGYPHHGNLCQILKVEQFEGPLLTAYYPSFWRTEETDANCILSYSAFRQFLNNYPLNKKLDAQCGAQQIRANSCRLFINLYQTKMQYLSSIIKNCLSDVLQKTIIFAPPLGS